MRTQTHTHTTNTACIRSKYEESRNLTTRKFQLYQPSQLVSDLHSFTHSFGQRVLYTFSICHTHKKHPIRVLVLVTCVFCANSHNNNKNSININKRQLYFVCLVSILVSRGKRQFNSHQILINFGEL